MILFCSRESCGRGYPVTEPKPKPKGWEPPKLCPTCRHGMEPLSRLRGGKEKAVRANPLRGMIS